MQSNISSIEPWLEDLEHFTIRPLIEKKLETLNAN